MRCSAEDKRRRCGSTRAAACLCCNYLVIAVAVKLAQGYFSNQYHLMVGFGDSESRRNVVVVSLRPKHPKRRPFGCKPRRILFANESTRQPTRCWQGTLRAWRWVRGSIGQRQASGSARVASVCNLGFPSPFCFISGSVSAARREECGDAAVSGTDSGSGCCEGRVFVRGQSCSLVPGKAMGEITRCSAAQSALHICTSC